jgi:dihydrofolate reductase
MGNGIEQHYVGLIVAADPDGVIGHNGQIPWHYREDLRRFRRVTTGGVLIMGRRTFESLSGRLPERRIIVVSSRTWLKNPFIPDAIAMDLWDALAKAVNIGGPVWIAGGGQIYEEAMDVGCVDTIDLTVVPPTGLAGQPGVTYFPMDGLTDYVLVREVTNPGNPMLRHVTYRRG